jgi:hypothetical protein
VRVVVARQTRRPHQRSILLAALGRSVDDAAKGARRTRGRRWPDAEAAVVAELTTGEPLRELIDSASTMKAPWLVRDPL